MTCQAGSEGRNPKYGKTIAMAKEKWVITGGAGFIGSNWASRLLQTSDARVHIFDNLSRRGVEKNLHWLREQTNNPERLKITVADVRDAVAVKRAMASATEVYHFAAQVAVTSSVTDPRHDFEVNALGTLNVLEAARHAFYIY